MAKHFSPALFKFLNELEANNEREWFNANKPRYESTIKDPAIQFIADFEKPLKTISPHFVADTRGNGGSLFRIYRDTRFSKDKTPYKTNTGMHFRHEMAKDVHSPGFYLNLEPGACFMGVGIWRPEPKVAQKIRQHIAEEPTRWKRATQSKKFTDIYNLDGDSLKRPPKGFDPDHPLIDDLKRKDFIAGNNLTQKQVTADGFIEDYTAMCKAAGPFMKFLCEAVGVPY